MKIEYAEKPTGQTVIYGSGIEGMGALYISMSLSLWACVQASEQEMGDRLRMAKADFHSIEELHSQRMHGGLIGVKDEKAMVSFK